MISKSAAHTTNGRANGKIQKRSECAYHYQISRISKKFMMCSNSGVLSLDVKWLCALIMYTHIIEQLFVSSSSSSLHFGVNRVCEYIWICFSPSPAIEARALKNYHGITYQTIIEITGRWEETERRNRIAKLRWPFENLWYSKRLDCAPREEEENKRGNI